MNRSTPYGAASDDDEARHFRTKPPKMTGNLPQIQVSETSPERTHTAVTLHGLHGPTTGRRPITDGLDKLDQRILEYKSQNFGDSQIAKILAEEESSDYSAKTIGTRYRRIRLAKMAANDAPLEFKVKHWTMNEIQDKALLKAYKISEQRHEHELAKLHARLFEDTAFTLNDLSSETFHSAMACEKRLEELSGGRAQPHPDDDDDPQRSLRDWLEGLAARGAEQCREQRQTLIAGEDEIHSRYLGKRASRSRKKQKGADEEWAHGTISSRRANGASL